MEPGTICPQCGSLLTGEQCSVCGGSTVGPLGTQAKAQESRALKTLLIFIAIYLVVAVGLVVFVGHLVMQRMKERDALTRAKPGPSQPLPRAVPPRHNGPMVRVEELKGNG